MGIEEGGAWVPCVRTGVVDEIVDDQLVVYDSHSDRVHVLNTAAAAIFDLCDGETPVEAIVAELERVIPEQAFDCDHEVPRILGEMLDQGLLE